MSYCTIGTAGHIDHGKTALVRALTGVDTDRLAEERRRSLSIELGFAHFDAPAPLGSESTLHCSIIDVPGHEKFIRTMLAGTTGIDMVLFVVAADDGVMPQSREHLDIVRLLNIERAVFALTKVDRVDEERVREVKSSVVALIKGTLLEGNALEGSALEGSALEGSPFVSTSVVTGEGIDELKALIVNECTEIKATERGPHFRLPVDRSFTIKGFGTVVTGTLTSGSISKNSAVSAFTTAGVKLSGIRVRGIESAHQQVESLSGAARCALNLAGVSSGALSRGSTLGESGLIDYISSSLKTSSLRARPLQIDCSFEFLPSFDKKGVLKGKRRLKFFHLTGESLASVRFPDKGDTTLGRLSISTPLVCLRGDRFILRDTATNTTVGGGRVLVPYYNRDLARGVAATDYKALKGTDVSKLLMALFGPREVALKVAGLEYMLNSRLEDIIKDAKGFLLSGEFLIFLLKRDALREKIIQILNKFHAENTSQKGLSLSSLKRQLIEDGMFSFRLAGSSLVKAVVDEMIAEGRLKRGGSLVMLNSHSPSLGAVDKNIETAVLALFEPGFKAVRGEELFGLPFKRADIEGVLSYLLNKGRIVKLKEGRFLSDSAIVGARESLQNALTALAEIPQETGAHQGITVSEFRDILGTGRKMAIEILEYFDRELVTVRRGDYRVLRTSQSKDEGES